MSRRLYERDFSGPCYVYCLFDPKRHRAFYIGITQMHPTWRLYAHEKDRSSAAWFKLNVLLDAGWRRDQILKIYRKCNDRNAALRLEHSLIVSTTGLVNKDRRKYQMWHAA